MLTLICGWKDTLNTLLSYVVEGDGILPVLTNGLWSSYSEVTLICCWFLTIIYLYVLYVGPRFPFLRNTCCIVEQRTADSNPEIEPNLKNRSSFYSLTLMILLIVCIN